MLLTVLRLVLTFVTFVLTAFSKLLTVVTLLLSVLRFVLTFVTFVLTELRRLLTVVTLLLTASTAPLLGILVKREASPICLP